MPSSDYLELLCARRTPTHPKNHKRTHKNKQGQDDGSMFKNTC